MINVKSRRAGALAVAAALMSAVPASAQNWSASDRTAGLTVNGRFTGLALTCTTSGSVEIVFSGFPARLEAGSTYTVPLTVDGTAFLYEAQARDGGERDGGERDFSELVHVASMGELSGLLDALSSGRSAEISSPAGRYIVPLASSSRALETLRRRCG
jgi:hypothetical protein